ncbi:MAG: serine/threonine protein kinase, partial [Actinomycetota bacterium]|nr:serine/threonine protein kinase [Actinomycetota bacterium]
MPDSGALISGRYRLDRQLAAGGMGTVWLARDELLRREVAVKALHVQPGLSDTERGLVVQRAMREARITARLHHPHAVQVFDVIDLPDGPCLIIEYVASRSPQDIVHSDGPLPPLEVARIGTQVAAALAAAHRAGIVHRDVKPGNILITGEGIAKITDFGISHAFDDVTLTSTGMVTGTPAFLAPEVARGADATPASDVYSLGSTLFYAAEGNSPFGSDTNPMGMLHRVASGHPQPPRRSGPLAPMLLAMMASNPSDRPRMVEITSRLPDLHPKSRDASEHPDAVATTQLLKRVSRVPSAAPSPPARRPISDRASPDPPPPSATAEQPVARRRSWIPVAAVTLAIALAIVLGIALLSNTSNHNAATRTNSTAGSSAGGLTHTPSASKAKASSASTTPAATSPVVSSATVASTVPPAVTAQDLTSAVVDYFKVVPGNLDAGWARLTTRFQQGRAQGRGTYDSYWNSIDRVDVGNVQASVPDTATAQLTYHYKDGRVVTQQTTFRFVRQDGVLK